MKGPTLLALLAALLVGCMLPSPENVQTSARIPPASKSGRPRSLDNILDLLRSGVRATPLLSRASDDCIDFIVVDSIVVRLRNAGADDEVIRGLRSICVDFSQNRTERNAREEIESSIGPVEAARRYSRAADAYFQQSEFGAAEGEIREALRLAPHNAEYLSSLGRTLGSVRKCAAAKQTFMALLEVESGYRYWAHFITGWCYQNTNRLGDAAIEYELALQAAWKEDQRTLIRELLQQVSRSP